jgi:hypothetical protein
MVNGIDYFVPCSCALENFFVEEFCNTYLGGFVLELVLQYPFPGSLTMAMNAPCCSMQLSIKCMKSYFDLLPLRVPP